MKTKDHPALRLEAIRAINQAEALMLFCAENGLPFVVIVERAKRELVAKKEEQDA